MPFVAGSLMILVPNRHSGDSQSDETQGGGTEKENADLRDPAPGSAPFRYLATSFAHGPSAKDQT
jgi:hypothetical protein